MYVIGNRMKFLFLLFIVAIFSSCVSVPNPSASSVSTPTFDIAITNVSVVPMDRERILPSRTVLIRDGKIIEISENDRSYNAAEILEGSGKYLIPALADMHVHIAEPFGPRGLKQQSSFPEDAAQEIADEVFLYLANGVTLVRNLDGWPLTLELRERINDGRILGPEINTSGMIVHGPGNGALYKSAEHSPGEWADSPEKGREIVRRQVAEGFDFIKVYNSMSPETYAAMVDEARMNNVKIGGHVPFDVGINGALAARQDSIEHLRGYDTNPANAGLKATSVDRFLYWLEVTDEQMAAFAETTAKAGTTNVPTMVVGDGMEKMVADVKPVDIPAFRYATPGIQKFNRQYTFFNKDMMNAILSTLPKVQAMIIALKNADAPIMAGTDTPLMYALPGFALHKELELYQSIGFSPFETLNLATTAPAKYLGRSSTRGKVAEQFEADLILLDANPLVDIRNTTKINAVISDGILFDRVFLDQRLAEIEARNRATLNQKKQ